MGLVGRPDANQVVGDVQPIYDLGELASRLRDGMYSNHPGGQTIFATDFYDGLAMFPAKTFTGTGGSAAVDSAFAEYRKQAMKVVSGTAIGNTATIERAAYISQPGHLAWDYSALYPLTINTRLYVAMILIVKGDNQYGALCRLTYTQATNALEIAILTTSPSTYTVIQTPNIKIDNVGFLHYTLYLDFSTPTTPKYEKIKIGDTSYDLLNTAVPATAAAGNNPTSVVMRIILESMTAASSQIEVGSAMFTTNVPQ